VLLLLSCAFLMVIIPAQASEQTRTPSLVLNLTPYVWLLVSRLDNKLLCEIPVGHAGPPTFEEIAQACGADLAQQWQDTAVCSSDVAGNVACSGLDLRMERTQNARGSAIIRPASHVGAARACRVFTSAPGLGLRGSAASEDCSGWGFR
jgi:hypothetical protein